MVSGLLHFWHNFLHQTSLSHQHTLIMKLYIRSNSTEQLIASGQVSRLQSGTSRERLVPNPDSLGIRFAERQTSRQVVTAGEIAFRNTAEEQLC